MTHPKDSYKWFVDAFDFDMTSTMVGHTAREVCDTCLKALLVCQDNFCTENGIRYFVSSLEDLCKLQKHAEKYGLVLSYNASKGLFELERCFSYWGKWRKRETDLSIEEALIYKDTVEEIMDKAGRLLPENWEKSLERKGLKIHEVNGDLKPITVIDFISRQVCEEVEREIVIGRTSGMIGIDKKIAEQLYDHVISLAGRGTTL